MRAAGKSLGTNARRAVALSLECRSATTSYIAQPRGRPPTTFRLTASGADWARFENPAHDFPQRIEYHRTPDGLHAETAGPDKDGKETVIPFDYVACLR